MNNPAIEGILWFFGFLITAGAWAVIDKWFITPKKENAAKMAEYQKRLDKGEERFKEISDALKINSKCLLALIDHEITGNGIEKMKVIKSDMQDFLVEKMQ